MYAIVSIAGQQFKVEKGKKLFVHKLPDEVDFDEAAFLEPIGLVVRSLEHSKPMVGETVAILGPGSLGLFHLQAYKAAGASKVIMVGLEQDRERFEIARELGADHIINLSKEEPVKAILACPGLPSPFGRMMGMTRPT